MTYPHVPKQGPPTTQSTIATGTPSWASTGTVAADANAIIAAVATNLFNPPLLHSKYSWTATFFMLAPILHRP